MHLHTRKKILKKTFHATRSDLCKKDPRDGNKRSPNVHARHLALPHNDEHEAGTQAYHGEVPQQLQRQGGNLFRRHADIQWPLNARKTVTVAKIVNDDRIKNIAREQILFISRYIETPISYLGPRE